MGWALSPLALLPVAAWGQSAGAEIFLPEDLEVRNLFERAEEYLKKGQDARAARVLARITARSLPASAAAGETEIPGDPSGDAADGAPGGKTAEAAPAAASPASRPSSATAGVLASGTSLALGTSAAVRKLVERLPREQQDRWRELVDPLLEKEWRLTRAPGAETDRRKLRRRILRDHADSKLHAQALWEEIAEAIERGDAGRGLGACRAVLAAGSAFSTSDRLRAAQLGLRAARAFARGGEDFQKAAADILSSREAAKLSETERAEARRLVGEGPFSPRPDAPAVEGGEAPDEYELGSVVWRHAYADRELRRWSSELVDRLLEGGEAGTARSVALPFEARADDDLILFQDSHSVTAVSLTGLEERWNFELPAAGGELTNALSVPALDPRQALVANGDVLTALDRKDGAILWQRKFVYDRRQRRLRAYAPGEAPPPAVEPAEPQVEPPPVEEPQPPEKKDAEPKKKADSRQDLPPVVTLSSPVVADGSLLLLASVRIQDELVLVLACLDSSGEERWATGLGSYRSADYLGQVASLSPPLCQPPYVFVSTNLGTVAAADLEDGALLWVRRYPRLSAAGRAETVRSRRRWAPGDPVIEGDLAVSGSQARGAAAPRGAGQETVLLAAPQDSNVLLALSPLTGELRWQLPRDQHTTLLGADRERCYLGGAVVSAVEIAGPAAGTSAWQWQPDDRGRIAFGRAALAPGRVLVSDNEALVQLDRRTGKPLSTTLWDFRGGGGNLLPAGGYLIAAGAGELLVYDHFQRGIDRAARLSEEERHLERSKLSLKRGDFPTAFTALAAWAGLRPNDPAANSALYRLRFEIAEIAKHWIDRGARSGILSQTDRAALHRFRVLLEPLAERKTVAAIQAAADLRAAGDFSGALAHLEEALRIDTPSIPYPIHSLLSIPCVEAIRDELMAIRSAGPPARSAFARFESHAEEALQEARRIGTQPAFRRVIERFPFTRSTLAARRELAEYLLNQQNPSEAIRCLLELLRDHPDASDYSAIKLRVADLLVETQRFGEAREVLAVLLRERPDDRLEETLPSRGGAEPVVRSVTVKEMMDRRLSELPLGIGKEDRVSTLRFPLRKRWRSPANLASSHRVFLHPDGERPAHMARTFLTRSREVIECRRLDDGFPLWTIELSLIPGFLSSSGAGYFLTTPPRLYARYAGDLMLVQDSRNVLAIDTRGGRIVWHKPFSRAEEPGGPANLVPGGVLGPPLPGGGGRATPRARIGRILPLAETVRGLTAGSDGTYVLTSNRRLMALSPEGVERWTRILDFEPGSDAAPEIAGAQVVVVQEAPLALHFFQADSGEPVDSLEVKSGADAHLLQRPILRQDGLASLVLPDSLEIVNLESRKLRGTYHLPGAQIEKAFAFPDLMDQLVLHLHFRGVPILVGVDTLTGRELWRYEKFPPRRSELSVHCEGSRLYVIHGEDRWSLLLLELRSDPERGRYYPAPLWPNEIPVGTFFSRESERQLLITQDAVIVPDPSSSSFNVYDKFKGSSLNARATAVNRFLVDKRPRFAMEVCDDALVVLTDGGDCGFEATPRASEGEDPWAKTRMAKRYVEKPDDWDNTSLLAGRLFEDGDLKTAIAILDRALLSEGLPSKESPGKYQLLSYLLAGMKEEAMKDPEDQAVVHCRRFRSPPIIDGEMNDAWNFTARMQMPTLRYVNSIPAPGQASDLWVGEEDLSGALYTGWDDEYFYFALDVEDSQIFPYDRNSEFWKGDCLIIGLDPTGDGGYFQRGDDQLLTLALTVPNRKAPGKGAKGEDEEEEEKQKPKGLFSVKKKEDNSGVVYEVALPWSTFRGDEGPADPPEPGRRFGLSLLLTDDDSGQGAMKTLSLNACHLLPRDTKKIWRFLIPEYFPKVILE